MFQLIDKPSSGGVTTAMCVYVFYKQAVVTPPEDGLSISRKICWGFFI
jgi:hypothetical protein